MLYRAYTAPHGRARARARRKRDVPRRVHVATKLEPYCQLDACTRGLHVHTDSSRERLQIDYSRPCRRGRRIAQEFVGWLTLAPMQAGQRGERSTGGGARPVRLP